MNDFYARIRIQDWYHDLSEQEDDEEVQQSITRAEGRDATAENQHPEWRIAHLEGVELEDRRHCADFREQCLDHHRHHKHKVPMRRHH